MQETRVIFVPAAFRDIREERIVKVATGRKKQNMLGFTVDEKVKERQTVVVGKSDCLVDGAQLARDVARAIEAEAANGFRVASITPVTSGNWAREAGKIGGGGGSIGPNGGSISSVSGSLGYSYGYSFTSGMMITLTRG